MIGYQVINELHIFCSAQHLGCKWQGPLSDLAGHINNSCDRKGKNLPDWWKKYLSSKESLLEEEEQARQNLDAETQDMMNKNEHEPLAMRLFNYKDLAQNDILKFALGYED
mgnify:CR=1 FL=1